VKKHKRASLCAPQDDIRSPSCAQCDPEARGPRFRRAVRGATIAHPGSVFLETIDSLIIEARLRVEVWDGSAVIDEAY
jgi:hypothetical protein